MVDFVSGFSRSFAVNAKELQNRSAFAKVIVKINGTFFRNTVYR